MTRHDTIQFSVEPAVEALGVRVAAFTIRGLNNTEYPPSWPAHVQDVLASVKKDGVGEDPLLEGFRLLHSSVGAPNRKNLAAPEALLKAVVKGRPLSTINPVVDMYNLASVTSKTAIGVHDLSRVSGSVTLRIARGDEYFVPLGETHPVPITPGEYVYVDESNIVICRLEVRQGAQTCVTEATSDCLFIVQGHKGFDNSAVLRTAEALKDEIVHSFGGEARTLYPVRL